MVSQEPQHYWQEQTPYDISAQTAQYDVVLLPCIPTTHSHVSYFDFMDAKDIANMRDARFFLKTLKKHEIARQMSTKLWVHTRKGPLETAHFSNILQRKFAEGGVAKLGISAWRHVSVAIVDAHIKDHVDVLESGQSAIIDCQRGHHSKTANTSYGGTGGYNVDRDSETRYKAASEALHRFWEVSTRCVQAVQWATH